MVEFFGFGKVSKATACERAEGKKLEGNRLFANHDYLSAIEHYSESIKLIEDSFLSYNINKDNPGWITDDLRNTNLHQYYANRSICNIKVENYGSAVNDATVAIELQPTFFKAYYRRGCAYLCLLKFKDAESDFVKVLSLCNDSATRLKLKECKRIIREQKFSEAIMRETPPPLHETIDLDKISVDESYKGPVYVPIADGHSNVDKNKFLKDVVDYIKVPGNKLHTKYLCMLIIDLISIVKHYSSLVDIELLPSEELTICGDIHGQFYDLLNIFELNGPPSEKNAYLFNGDFVDRGSFSVECAVTLILSKVLFPDKFHVVRGNHETSAINKCYGFKGEVIDKYDDKVYTLFCECFRYLPLGYLLNSKVLVVHGGLFGTDNVTLNELREIDRVKEPSDTGLMTDMLWSDPKPTYGISPSKRGIAYEFGPDVTDKFLRNNNLDYIIRSHEVKHNGYDIDHNGKVVTIFSAPNYCDQMGNKGAFIRYVSYGTKLFRPW